MSNNNNYTSVLVGNVSTEATAETLSGFFGFCGEIRDIELRSGTHEAVIKFGTHEAAETACMLTDTPVLDQSITVAPFVSDGESSGPAPKEDEAEKEKEEKKVEEASNDTNAQEAKDGKEEEEVKTETPEAAEAEIPEKKNAAEEEAETTEQKSAEISEKPEEKSPSTPADTPADSDSTDDSEAMKADVLHVTIHVQKKLQNNNYSLM